MDEKTRLLICLGAEYLERFGTGMLPSHLRAVRNIAECRTESFGGHLAVCDHCGEWRSPITPAGTGAVSSATGATPKSGLMKDAASFSRLPTSTLSSPCPKSSMGSSVPIRGSSTASSSRQSPLPSWTSPGTPAMSEARRPSLCAPHVDQGSPLSPPCALSCPRRRTFR